MESWVYVTGPLRLVLHLSLEVHRHAIDPDVMDGRVMNNLRRGLRDIFDDDKVAESWTELGRVTDPEWPS